MLYFAEYFSGLFAKSSKFYQEHTVTIQRSSVVHTVFAPPPFFPAAAAVR